MNVALCLSIASRLYYLHRNYFLEYERLYKFWFWKKSFFSFKLWNMKLYLKVSVPSLSQLSFTIDLEIKQIRILLQSTNWPLLGVTVSLLSCLSLMVWWINLINMSLQLRKWRRSSYLCSQRTCTYLVPWCRLLCIVWYPFFALCKGPWFPVDKEILIPVSVLSIFLGCSYFSTILYYTYTIFFACIFILWA